MRYDVHTHFFTSGMIAKGLERFFSVMRLREALERLPGGDRSGKLEPSAPMAAFLRNGLSMDGEEELEELDAAAGEPMAYCPLMMDVEYMHDAAPSAGVEVAGRVAESFADTLAGWKEGLLARRDKPDAALDMVASWISEAEGRVRSVAKDRPGEAPGESFETQLATLTELKKRHPERVFPFLGVDPRRDQAEGKLLELVGDLVGKGKPFAGIKLYPPIGFSPTDPFLFGPGGLYELAQAGHLPITLHFSAAGFGAMVDRVAVRGDVYDPDSGEIAPADALYDRGVVAFDTTLVNIRDSIPERIRLLNHPKLWAKVLAAYPDLTLNLAHFGGFGRVHSHLDGKPAGHWAAFARDAITRHRNVYADLSGWFERPGDPALGHPLSEFVSKVYAKLPPHARAKLLYGSDWFILSLKDPDLAGYIARFKAAFGKDWDAISSTNPAAFLAATV